MLWLKSKFHLSSAGLAVDNRWGLLLCFLGQGQELSGTVHSEVLGES